MVLKAKKALIVAVFCSAVPTAGAEPPMNEPEAGYLRGVLLFRDGTARPGQWKTYGEGIFLRDEKAGKMVQASDVTDIVSDDYYQKIKNGTPGRSMFESLVYFHASSEYQWRGFNAGVSHEDLYVRIGKIALLALTGITYYNASQANRALGGSYEGFNDQQKARFVRSYNSYLAASSLTLGFFGYATARAYVRFGRNGSGDNLDIPGSRLGESAEAAYPGDRRQVWIGYDHSF